MHQQADSYNNRPLPLETFKPRSPEGREDRARTKRNRTALPLYEDIGEKASQEIHRPENVSGTQKTRWWCDKTVAIPKRKLEAVATSLTYIQKSKREYTKLS